MSEPEHEPEPEQPHPTDPYGEPANMPTLLDVIGPNVVILVIGVLCLILLSVCTQSKWWKKWCFCKKRTRATDGKFFTNEDYSVLQNFAHYQNRPLVLIKIAAPALLSICLCPITLFLYVPLVKFFWPPEDFKSLPNANDAIQAFLTPAGLVYAIAFGFAFQEATKVQAEVSEKLAQMVNYSFNIAQSCMTLSEIFSCEDRATIICILKEESIIWMKQILAYSKKLVEHTSRMNEIIAVVKKSQDKIKKPLDKTFVKKLLNDVYGLEELTLHSLGKLRGSMDILQWSFLETLAYLAFFGVLMLNAQSYTFQVTVCIITVFSISIFCYILADLDNPYHGFYRVDISMLPALMYRLEEVALRNDHVPATSSSLSVKDHGRFSMDNIVIA